MKQYRVNNKYKKIIAWGSGKYYKMYSSEIGSYIEYIIDSDKNKQNKRIYEKEIKSPEQLTKEDTDSVLIVICSGAYDAIEQNIKLYGEFDIISAEYFYYSLLEIKEDVLSEALSSKKVILSISDRDFTFYENGVSKFICEQMKTVNKHNMLHLHIFWKKYTLKDNTQGNLIGVVKDGKAVGLYSIQEFISKVAEVSQVMIHFIPADKKEILFKILDEVKVKQSILYYAHDYLCVCGNINLLRNDFTQCKAYKADWKICEQCNGRAARKNTVDFHKKLFKYNKICIVAPSESTAQVIKSLYKEISIEVIPHQVYETQIYNKVCKDKLKIAYVGYKNVIKGWETFKQLFYKYNSQYDFYCLGYNDDIIEGIHYVDVNLDKSNKTDMVSKMKEYNIDIALLWSICLETYSYTYYESYEAGVFVITSSLSGNIADQVRKNKNGIVLENQDQLYELMQNKDRLRGLVEKCTTQIVNLRPNEKFLRC